jgi:hypothetical protein
MRRDDRHPDLDRRQVCARLPGQGEGRQQLGIGEVAPELLR